MSEQVMITRIFDAPRDEVFRAWTDSEEVAAWYGPDHFQTEHVHIDLRVGGRYELTMVRRDGSGEMPLGYEIVELDPPALLVLRADEGQMTVRVELHDHGDKTRMTLTDGPLPAGWAEHATSGYEQALDKLAARVAA